MIAQILMLAAAGTIFLLGAIHLVYTFRGKKLWPRDPELQIRMSEALPVITRQTTMWKAWIGFNATHSMSAILFGLIYGYLGAVHPELLFRSPFLIVVGVATLAGFAVLARQYFFSTPFRAVCFALGCYVASIAV